MPTMAMSSGARPARPRPAAGRAGARAAPRPRGVEAPAPTVTAGCRAAIVVGGRRRTATWPTMNMPVVVLALPRPTATQPSRLAAHALAGDPQPADVQPLQPLPDVLAGRPASAASSRLHAVEVVDERAGHAACGVPGGGLQQHGARRGDRLALEERLDRAVRDRLLGEQVRGAHQRRRAATPRRASGPRAPRPSRRSGRRGCPRRRRPGPLSVPADPSVPRRVRPWPGLPCRRGTPRVSSCASHSGKLVARPDVAAALGALEHEPAGPGAQELTQQSRRRYVQERRDALGLQRLAWVGRPPAMMRDRRPDLPDRLELRGRSSSGAKPSTPTPHGRSPSAARGLREHPRGTARRWPGRAR